MTCDLIEAIQKARQLLANNRHAAIATVNEDGTPHNTPFFFLYEKDLSRVYWGSHPKSQHSLNIARGGRAFLVLYDSVRPKKGGIYLDLEHCHELSGGELAQALQVHNEFRARENKPPIEVTYYEGDGPQRMYSGTLAQCWVLLSENDPITGLRVRDYRQRIELSELT